MEGLKTGYYWIKVNKNRFVEVAHYKEYSSKTFLKYGEGEFTICGSEDYYHPNEVTILSGPIEFVGNI